MKNIIYNEKTGEVLALVAAGALAHDVAECISYVDHGNSTYGLYGIKVVNYTEAALPLTAEGERFRAAWNRFIGGVR